MQLHFLALLRLVIPVSLVILAYVFREYLAGLSTEMRILVSNMPYLTCIAAVFMAFQFRRVRMLLAAVAVAALYWLIQSELQVSLSDANARGIFLGVSVSLPILALFLFAVPERGIWNIHGLITVIVFSALAIACFYLPIWLPALSESLDAQIHSRSSGGYLLPNVIALMSLAVILFATFLLSLRNNDSEAALTACVLALFLTLQFLHLDYISIALCTAAGVCLVYGLLLSSHAMAYRDDLTGLFGRRALNERLKSLGRHYSIAMVDVDHFKKFNDKFGHDVGDQVLRLVASRIKQVAGGTAYRYGGEEFALVFPRKEAEQCLEPLELLRTSIADYEMSLRDSKLRPKKTSRGTQKRGATRVACGHVSVTVSIGVAERCEESDDAMSVLKKADKNLYRAKRGGRNRIAS
ncbi:MAG: diguanylate cyclase [Halioglobus sp.]